MSMQVRKRPRMVIRRMMGKRRRRKTIQRQMKPRKKIRSKKKRRSFRLTMHASLPLPVCSTTSRTF
jgi:hypothetical protein